MSDRLKDLYQEVILKHNGDPQNFLKREDAQHWIEAYNPVCGDQFQLYFDLKEGKLSNLSFHGYGCAISKASASILTQLINGETTKGFIEINSRFRKVLSENTDKTDLPEELLAFAPVIQHPGRIKCVTLSWDCLIDYIETNGYT